MRQVVGRRVRMTVLVCGFMLAAAMTAVPWTSVAAQDAASTKAQALSLEIKKIRGLALSHSDQAALALSRIVRFNSRLPLRIEAARALGTCAAPTASRQLAWSIARGGPDAVRAELAKSLARRGDGLDGWQRMYAKDDIERLGRVQLVAALETCMDKPSRQELLKRVRDADPAVRVAAMWAVSRRADARPLLVPLLEVTLEQRTDRDTVAAVLELAVDLPVEELSGLVSRVKGPMKQDPLAKYLAERVVYLRKLAEYKRKKSTDYALPNPPVEPKRPMPAKEDLVFLFDGTVSELGLKRAYLEEALSAAATSRAYGRDVRLAIVGYRDELKDQNQRDKWWKVRTSPLTSDLEAAIDWGHALPVGGVGDREASIFAGLEAALARMNWRPGAARKVTIFTATEVDQPKRATALVKAHRELDGVALQVRVRPGGKRTRALENLSRAGGTEIGSFRPPRRFR